MMETDEFRLLACKIVGSQIGWRTRIAKLLWVHSSTVSLWSTGGNIPDEVYSKMQILKSGGVIDRPEPELRNEDFEKDVKFNERYHFYGKPHKGCGCTIRYKNGNGCVRCAKIKQMKLGSVERIKKWTANKTHPERMISWAKYRHKKGGYSGIFDLTIDNLYFPEFCPALGYKLIYSPQPRNTWESATMDRIDSTKGYTADNVQVLSRRANYIKNDSTPEVLMQVAEYMMRVKNARDAG